MYTCVSCVSVSSVSLDVKILCKNNVASQVSCLRSKVVKDHFDWSQYFSAWQGKNPSMEDLPGNSLRMTVDHKTLKILPRGVNLSRRNAASMIVLEIAEWFDLQHNFLILDKAKALPIRIGNQTV